MSILIKGMEMPKNCLSCPLQGGTADCRLTQKTYNWGLTERPSDCPLVPVPPHGRLIDADALAKRIKDEGRNQAEYYADRYAPVVMAYGDCHGKVQSAPTIIPAEEGE